MKRMSFERSQNKVKCRHLVYDGKLLVD